MDFFKNAFSFPFFRSLLLGSLLFFHLPVFSEGKEETIRLDQIIIRFNPKDSPRVISEKMVPEGSVFLAASEFTRNYFESFTDSSETFLLMENDKSFEDLCNFYDAFFKENEWRVLQREKSDGKIKYLVESSTRRTLALYIKEDSGKRKIKMFHRRNYSL